MQRLTLPTKERKRLIDFIKPVSKHSTLGIWQVQEPIESLDLSVSQKEMDAIKDFHPNKQIEYIASRMLIERVSSKINTPYNGVNKDEHGKPHLNGSNHHLSISHSFPIVGCLVNTISPCGLDIEKPREQLRRIQHKFLNPEEIRLCNENLDLLCLAWCAKESIYKIHGRKDLFFSQHIFIDEILDGRIIAHIKTPDLTQEVQLSYEQIGEYYIVYNR